MLKGKKDFFSRFLKRCEKKYLKRGNILSDFRKKKYLALFHFALLVFPRTCTPGDGYKQTI